MSIGKVWNAVSGVIIGTCDVALTAVGAVDKLAQSGDRWATVALEASEQALDSARIERHRNTLILEAELAQLGLSEVPAPKRNVKKIAATIKEVKAA